MAAHWAMAFQFSIFNVHVSVYVHILELSNINVINVSFQFSTGIFERGPLIIR